MPLGIAARHPWDYKCQLDRYTAAVDWDALVWLDVDMMVLSDIEPALNELRETMLAETRVVAVADSGRTIGEQLAAEPAPAYAALLQGMDQSAPYLNSGFFMCRSRGFLDVWARQTALMQLEVLFEQNAFNLTVLGSRQQVLVLDRFRWNLVANDLDFAKIEVCGDCLAVTGPAGRALILHATSPRETDLFATVQPVSVNGRDYTSRVRMIGRPEELLSFQVKLMHEILQAEAGLLMECGVWR
jgi:hypothetical protein